MWDLGGEELTWWKGDLLLHCQSACHQIGHLCEEGLAVSFLLSVKSGVGSLFYFFSLLLVNISIIDILCTHNAEVMGWDNTLLSPSLAPTFPSTSKAFDFQNTMLAFVLGIKSENRKYRFNSFKVLWLLFCARMNGPDKISLEFPFFPVAWLNRLFKFQLYMTLTICLICKRLSGIHIG